MNTTTFQVDAVLSGRRGHAYFAEDNNLQISHSQFKFSSPYVKCIHALYFVRITYTVDTNTCNECVRSPQTRHCDSWQLIPEVMRPHCWQHIPEERILQLLLRQLVQKPQVREITNTMLTLSGCKLEVNTGRDFRSEPDSVQPRCSLLKTLPVFDRSPTASHCRPP